MNGFDRCSLAIELAYDFFPFKKEYLEQPRLHDHTAVRVFVHETLHFWQVLSSGFIANLALSEWRNLLKFECSGEFEPRAKILEDFTRKNIELGFSAYNLTEALARYWDLHITGPQKNLRGRLLRSNSPDLARLGLDNPTDLPGSEAKAYTGEQFDNLMLLEDAYAAPYRLSLERWGSLKSVLLFPLVGYFSLQTPAPVEVFCSVMKSNEIDRINFNEYRDIHIGWRSLFEDIRNLCKLSAMFVGQVGAFTPGWDVIKRSPLNIHPVYCHYLQTILTLQNKNTDFYFACPGDPECRAYLVSYFLPPLTILANDRWIGESSSLKKAIELPANLGEGLLEAEMLANKSQDIHTRSRKMRQAQKLASLGVTKKQL
jgi:hypothetical protein